VACDVVAAVAVVDMARGVADGVCWAVADACVECLLGCWDEALALERVAGVCWRKAAKKVERKKGRWEDILTSKPYALRYRTRPPFCQMRAICIQVYGESRLNRRQTLAQSFARLRKFDPLEELCRFASLVRRSFQRKNASQRGRLKPFRGH